MIVKQPAKVPSESYLPERVATAVTPTNVPVGETEAGTVWVWNRSL